MQPTERTGRKSFASLSIMPLDFFAFDFLDVPPPSRKDCDRAGYIRFIGRQLKIIVLIAASSLLPFTAAIIYQVGVGQRQFKLSEFWLCCIGLPIVIAFVMLFHLIMFLIVRSIELVFDKFQKPPIDG